MDVKYTKPCLRLRGSRLLFTLQDGSRRGRKCGCDRKSEENIGNYEHC